MPTLTGLKLSEIDLLVKNEYLSGYETYQMVGPQIFNLDTPQRLNEKESVVASDGDIPEVDEGTDYPETQVREIGTKTYTTVEYKRKIGITRLMRAFSNYGSVMKEMNKLGYRARYKQDQLMADVLTGGFATGTTWDGQYLFGATHQIADTGLTQSNLLTGAFSKTNVNNAYIALSTMKDHSNLVMPLSVAYLIVPAALAQSSYEVLNSPDDPTTANRSKNFTNTLNIQRVVWPLLDANSTSAFYMCSEKMFHSLTAFQKETPSIKMYIDEDNDNMYEKVYFSQTQGATDYLGLVASAG